MSVGSKWCGRGTYARRRCPVVGCDAIDGRGECPVEVGEFQPGDILHSIVWTRQRSCLVRNDEGAASL